MNDLNFKNETKNILKQIVVMAIGMAAYLLCMNVIMLLWCYAMVYIENNFPQDKTQIESLGLIGLGYIVISSLFYSIKIISRYEKPYSSRAN